MALIHSHVPGFVCTRGKVRDVYDLGDTLVIVASDRISAFDWIMGQGIPGKGIILTQMSRFWFDFLGVAHHVLSYDLSDLPSPFQQAAFEDRTMLVEKCQVFPVECVARGYLLGSGWKEYQQTGRVCGLELPPGLQLAEELPVPIFTPATKASSGHDENISFEQMSALITPDYAKQLRSQTLKLYQDARAYAATRGIIIADTKFEWGLGREGKLRLVDEVLTPDSSRFWSLTDYQKGSSPPSYDKQILRDWLETTTWDKNSPPPDLPEEIIDQTRERYEQVFRVLTIPSPNFSQ